MCDLGPFMIIYHGLHWHSFILSPVSEKELLSNEWPRCSYVHIWRIKQIFFDSFFCFRKSSSHFYANESEGIMDSDEPPTKRPRSDSPPTEKGEKKSFGGGCACFSILAFPPNTSLFLKICFTNWHKFPIWENLGWWAGKNPLKFQKITFKPLKIP